MRIAHLYDGHEQVYDGSGSVPDVVWNNARYVSKRGHNVTVIERQWDGTDRLTEHDTVSFRRLPLRTGSDIPWERIPYDMVSSPSGAARLLLDRFNFAISALLQLRQLEFDVLHVHLPFAANVLVTIAPWLRDHMVYTAHLGETQKRVVDPRFSPDVYLAKRTARTIVLNPEMKAAFESRGANSGRLVIVPNGVDIERFRDVPEKTRRRVEREYDLGNDQVVLFVGTVTPRKGVEELMQAASHVITTDRSDIRFVIVGKTDLEPEYMDRVRTIVRENDLDEHVVFTGFVSEEDLHALYRLADLFVLPSYEEGSSIVVTEAIAAGLPVVGSRIGGIEQQIDHGKHGMLVPPGDVAELSECLAQLLDDSDERNRMRNEVAQRAEELSWESLTDNLLTVYREVQEA